MELELTGMTALLGKLETLRTEIPGPAMRKAVRAGANVIRDAMEEMAPVLDRKTAESTSLEPGELKAGLRVYMPPNADPVEAVIGPKAQLERPADWVEHGHRLVKGGYSKITGTGTRGPGRQARTDEGELVDVPAHPFLRPAFDVSVAEAEAAMQASLTGSFEEIVAK